MIEFNIFYPFERFLHRRIELREMILIWCGENLDSYVRIDQDDPWCSYLRLLIKEGEDVTLFKLKFSEYIR